MPHAARVGGFQKRGGGGGQGQHCLFLQLFFAGVIFARGMQLKIDTFVFLYLLYFCTVRILIICGILSLALGVLNFLSKQHCGNT